MSEKLAIYAKGPFPTRLFGVCSSLIIARLKCVHSLWGLTGSLTGESACAPGFLYPFGWNLPDPPQAVG